MPPNHHFFDEMPPLPAEALQKPIKRIRISELKSILAEVHWEHLVVDLLADACKG
jgi:hypothetical protein